MQDVVNSEQAQAWNGPEGAHWARHQDRWNAVNGVFDEPLLDAAGIRAEDQVLDIGCGAGSITRLAAVRAIRGAATGIDLSGPMLDAARSRAEREGITRNTYLQADAQVHHFPLGFFDVAVSRYGVMFFTDPVAAFRNLAAALRPGGRLAFVCPARAALNEWVAALNSPSGWAPTSDFDRGAGPGMFSLSDPVRVRGILEASGFTGVTVEQVQAYGTWGRGAPDAADFLLGTGPGRYLSERLAPEGREQAREVLTAHLGRHETADGTVRMLSTSWLVTAATEGG